MKKLALFVFLILSATVAVAQHPQRMISALTACRDMACVEKVRTTYKSFKAYTPLRTQLDKQTSEYMLDIGYSHGKEQNSFNKVFRLSLLVQNGALLYGQLEQLTPAYQIEATYVFVNKVQEIEQYLAEYNQQNKGSLIYKTLIGRLTNRNPTLFRLD